jgi:hypothetical protein
MAKFLQEEWSDLMRVGMSGKVLTRGVVWSNEGWHEWQSSYKKSGLIQWGLAWMAKCLQEEWSDPMRVGMNGKVLTRGVVWSNEGWHEWQSSYKRSGLIQWGLAWMAKFLQEEWSDPMRVGMSGKVLTRGVVWSNEGWHEWLYKRESTVYVNKLSYNIHFNCNIYLWF